jgi:predicted double-glycine peptidase
MALLYPKGIKGSKVLDFPELRQTYSYDCGVSAAQSVLTYYGYTEDEEALFKKVKPTNPELKEYGVKTKDLVKLFKDRNLSAEIVKGLSAKDLPKYIEANIPVIILIQAYGNKKTYATSFKDGHYVVAIGYDRDRIIFEDPSSYTRNFLTFKEVDERWHAIDDNNKPDMVSVAIPVKGIPKFNSNELTKMP